ncbi:hypothetical protein ACFQBQ_09430 [Granulicella cerasi]|uniref:MetA-pathway of phenol degradation n=1 Tax=Granulicella cerasi TaxID=741063 RepID=A0ABW1Z8S6_9BACT|nr:hypothetical protein [Granulicella cerasi]
MTRFHTGILAMLLALTTGHALAQAKPTSGSTDGDLDLQAASDANNLGPEGIVPEQKGMNFSLIGTAQHDSATGWAGLMTPVLAYRFGAHFSADVSAPIDVYILGTTTGGTVLKPTTNTAPAHWVPGDTALALHANLDWKKLGYVFTPTLTAPTGDYDLGLGTGHYQYDFANHLELDVPLQPFVDLGIGNSTAIVNRRVQRKQNATGINSHFEAGVGIDLPFGMNLSLSAYEFLPIGNQTVYSKKVLKKKNTTRTTTSNGLAEDNGFNTSLDIPIERHLTISGFYSRSLRQHNDTCGGSITFQLRPPRKKTEAK